MQLQGMSDEQYQKILSQVPEIQFLLIQAGKMATKSRVENVLMAKYGLDRSDAHTFTNMSEQYNCRDFYLNPLTWVADRPRPRIEDWPELVKQLQNNGR